MSIYATLRPLRIAWRRLVDALFYPHGRVMTDQPPEECCNNCHFFHRLNIPKRIAGEEGKDGICNAPRRIREHTLYTHHRDWCEKWKAK